MLSLDKAIQQWSHAPRPLKNLGKAQLFKYPDTISDISTPDGPGLGQSKLWDWSREVLTRSAIHANLERAYDRSQLKSFNARLRIGQAHVEQTKAKGDLEVDKANPDALVIKLLTERVALSKKGIEVAEKHLQVCLKEEEAAQEDLHGVDNNEGVLSLDEIDGYMRKRYQGDWDKAVTAWKANTLFVSQTHSWFAFLAETEENVHKDRQTYADLCSLAQSMRAHDGVLMKEVHAFFQIRIMPQLRDRQVYLNDDQVDVASLDPKLKHKYFHWARRYNSATFFYKWQDLSGVAYDPRTFDPKRMSQEERQYA